MINDSTHNVCFDATGLFRMSDSILPENGISLSELPDNPKQLIELGERCLRSRLVLEAEKCFTNAVANNHGLTVAHYWLGYLYNRQGKYEQAALELGKCLAAQPRNGYAYAELGLVYFKLGNIQEARALWQQGLLLTSHSDQPLTELLQHMSFYVALDGEDRVVPNLCHMATLVAERDIDLAYSYLERAYTLEPFNPAVLEAFAVVFSIAGRNNEAGLAWKEAVRLSPQDASLQAKLAEYYLSLGENEKAKARAEKAVELAPDNAMYRLRLAQTEKCLGNLKIAEQHLRIAHKLEPEHPEINFELGCLLWSHGKSPTAFSFLRKSARSGYKEAISFLALINIKKEKKRLLSRTGKEGKTFEQTTY